MLFYFILLEGETAKYPKIRNLIPLLLSWEKTCHTNSTACRRTVEAGPRFSKVPKLFGRISVDIIRFVYSKRRPLEAGNFAVILLFIPFTTYEKTSFIELAGWSLTNGFRARKVFGTFEKQAPDLVRSITS